MNKRGFLRICIGAAVAGVAAPLFKVASDRVTIDTLQLMRKIIQKNRVMPTDGKFVVFLHPDAAHNLGFKPDDFNVHWMRNGYLIEA